MQRTIHLLVDQTGVGFVHHAVVADAALVVFGLSAAVVARTHVPADNLAVFGDADAFSEGFLHMKRMGNIVAG